MALSVVYVCDEGHVARLAISLESWTRFRAADVFVVDYGLTPETRRRLGDMYGAIVLSPVHPRPVGDRRRIGAYREKTLAPMVVAETGLRAGDPIVLLDSDIIVLDGSFFTLITDVGEQEVAAVPSAWDVDFTWSYRPRAESVLRELSGLAEFDHGWTIPNSGVVSARSGTWRAVCPDWASLYDRFLDLPDRQILVRPGTMPGDQEFLRLALARTGHAWRRLHGSCNMQVSPERMYWGPQTHQPLAGGHFDEPPQVVRAVHYGVESDGAIALSEAMLANGGARASITMAVDDLREAAMKRGWVFRADCGARDV